MYILGPILSRQQGLTQAELASKLANIFPDLESLSLRGTGLLKSLVSGEAVKVEMKYIRRMIFWENAFLSFFGLLLTIPFGYLSYWWTLDYMLEDKFYVPREIPWFSWPFVLLLSFFSIWLATGRLTRKIKKIDLADELRQTGAT